MSNLTDKLSFIFISGLNFVVSLKSFCRTRIAPSFTFTDDLI